MSNGQYRGLAGIVDRTDGLSDVPAVWYAVGAVLLDRAVTLPFWHYEANPLVAGMGQGEWLAVTALLIGGLLVAWYPCNAREIRAAHWLAWAVTAVHLLVVALNLSVVTGVL